MKGGMPPSSGFLHQFLPRAWEEREKLPWWGVLHLVRLAIGLEAPMQVGPRMSICGHSYML